MSQNLQESIINISYKASAILNNTFFTERFLLKTAPGCGSPPVPLKKIRIHKYIYIQKINSKEKCNGCAAAKIKLKRRSFYFLAPTD